jgi:outer membrane protein assembly factor BamB
VVRRLVLLLLLATAHSGEGDVRLLTDEAIPRYLQRGQQLARSGEWAKMIDILHRVIIGDAEIFPELDEETLHSAVHTDDGVLYYPARELCVRELSRLPPEGLNVYRATYDVPAGQLMKQAAAAETLDDRLDLLTRVFDTYLVSSSGDDALEQAADLHLQLGHYFECLALLRRLLDVYPSDTDRDLPMARTKAAYCAARIGDRDTRNDMLERLAAEAPGRRVLVEGKRIAVEDLPGHPVMKVIGAIDMGGEDDWPMAGGNATRSRLGQDLPADLPRRPFWRHSLQARDSRFYAPLGYWMRRVHDRETAVAPADPQDYLATGPYPTVRPVVLGDVLYFKDYVELVSRRIASGELAFKLARTRLPQSNKPLRHREHLPVALVRPSTDTDPTSASRFESVYRWFDYGGNDVVATADQIVVTSTPKAPQQLIEPGAKAPPNALEIHSQPGNGLVWGWNRTGDLIARSVYTDPKAREEWKRDHRTHRFAYFRGPGVVSGGILYTVVEEQDGPKDKPGGISLWAMRMRDGQVLYRTQLHHHDTITSQLPTNACVSVAGAVVYVLTNAGVLCAVDALPPGRIRWIRRYPRSIPANARGPRKKVHIVYAYNEPLIAGGKVIVMAPDAARVQAIDAETGVLAWELEPRELGDVRHIVGVRGQTLVLAGSGITAVDLQRGKVKWSQESLGEVRSLPYGRGFLSETIAYIPAISWQQRRRDGRSFVYRFEIESGKPLERYVFDVPRLGNIICLGGRLIACNEDEVMCFTTADRELAALDKRIEASPGDRSRLLLERALVRLKANPDDRATALADIRKALGEKPTSIELRWRMIDLLIEEAKAQKSVEPLAEAREIAVLLRPLQSRHGTNKQFRPYEAQIDFVETGILADAAEAEKAVEQLQAFVEKHGREEVIVDGKILKAPVAARALRTKLMSNNAFRAAFETVVRRRIAEAAEARDKNALAVISEQFGSQPPAEEAWFELARLHIEDKETGKAEEALRTILRDFPGHPRRAEAHLRLAILLAKNSMLVDARRERDLGLAELDAESRTRFADQIAELKKLLPEEAKRIERPTLQLPLRTETFEPAGATPIPVEGKAPGEMKGVSIVADGAAFAAIDEKGALKWKIANAAGAAPDAGPPGEASTLAVATALANARFARWIDGDVLVADAMGVVRINPATGDSVWRQPSEGVAASRSAAGAIAILHKQLGELARSGHKNRTTPLPAHVVRGDMIVRVHPAEGVVAYSLATGAVLWEDEQATGELAGPPSLVGQLLAVGRAEPGAIDIFDLGSGQRVRRLGAPGAVLLSAPMLDRLGRLYLVAGSDATARQAAFHVIDAKDGSRLLENPIEVHSRYAAVLHADDALVVFHDGSSGGDNLHFFEFEAKRHVQLPTEDLARELHTIRDGSQLYVFTHKLGVADEGARLFRIDLSGRAALRYERPRRAPAYARPLLTSRYIGIVGAGSREANVMVYEREASKDLSPPAPVFPILGGRTMERTIDFEPEEGAPLRLNRPPALAAAGSGLVAAHPFGTFRLRAGDTR